MWPNVLTRLKLAISWHISILCVYKGPKGVLFRHSCEKPQRLSHCIFRNAAPNIQKKRQESCGFKIHRAASEATDEVFPPTEFHRVTAECRRDSVPWQTLCYRIIWPFCSLNNGGPDGGQRGPTLGCMAQFYLCISWDLRRIPSCGVYWRRNAAKWSCGGPICKYGPCQPNCSPCWQWFGPRAPSCPKNTGFLWGWLETRQGVVRQNRQCLFTAVTEFGRQRRRQIDAPKIKEQKVLKECC